MSLEWYKNNGIDIGDSIGIDEVGRGPLAGPVVSVAVWICSDLAKLIEANKLILPVRDSKKMTQIQRRRVVGWMEKQSHNEVLYSIGYASVEEIDELNILNASLLSMKRAYDSLGISKSTILVDGNVAPDFCGKQATSKEKKPYTENEINIKTVIKGDEKVLSISLASIIAKEYRDSIMRKLSRDFPQYRWDTNVGYGSKAHLEALLTFGPTCHHRKSFSPISSLMSCGS